MTSKRKDVAPRVAVLCGNKREFDRYVHEKKQLGSTESYIYIHEPRQLMGMQLDSMDVTGTFMSRPDAHEIYDLARMRVNPTTEFKGKLNALNRKDLETITREVMTKKYDAWAQQNSVIPTLVGDPDFGSKVVNPQQHVWSNKTLTWQKAQAPQVCANPTCSTPAATDQGYVHCKFCIEDMRVSQGAEKPVQSLSKEYVDMMIAGEDAKNLNKSMDILFPEKEDK